MLSSTETFKGEERKSADKLNANRLDPNLPPPGAKESKNFIFKKYLKDKIETILKEEKQATDIEFPSHENPVEVAHIELMFKDREVIELLKQRQLAVLEKNEEKVKAIEVQIEAFRISQGKESKVPRTAIIIFTYEEGF